MDKIFPWLLGHRTELIGLVNFALVVAKSLGAPIPDTLLWNIHQASVPLGVATFAAKVTRLLGPTAEPQTVLAVPAVTTPAGPTPAVPVA